MENIAQLLQHLEVAIPKHALTNPAISKSSVGWHVEHSLLTIDAIILALEKSAPDDYNWRFNLRRTFVFTTNKIPRGRAQAPKRVQPQTEINFDTLTTHLNNTIQHLKKLDTLKPNNYFEHPFFGNLNVKPAIKFLAIHTRHHLDIINDIIQAQ